MKRFIIVSAILLLLLGCKSKDYDKVYIGSNYGTGIITDFPVQEAVFYFKDTIRRHARILSDYEVWGGAPVLFMAFEKEGVKEQYSIILDTLYVTDKNNNLYRYKIDQDYYFNEFYPFMTKLLDDYFPVIYQIEMSECLMISYEEDGIRKGIPPSNKDRLSELLNYAAINWQNASEYAKSLDDCKYKIIINDFVMEKTLYLFENYMVINGRKIILDNKFNIDDVFNALIKMP